MANIDKISGMISELEKGLSALKFTQRDGNKVEVELAAFTKSLTAMRDCYGALVTAVGCMAPTEQKDDAIRVVGIISDIVEEFVVLTTKIGDEIGVVSSLGWVRAIVDRTDELVAEGMPKLEASIQAIKDNAPIDEQADLIARIALAAKLVACVESGPNGVDEFSALIGESDPALVKSVLGSFPGAHDIGGLGMAIPVDLTKGAPDLMGNILDGVTRENNTPLSEDTELPWIV